MTTVYVREFPEDLHKKVKIQAAVEGTTLRDITIRALTQYLERQETAGKPKARQRKE